MVQPDVACLWGACYGAARWCVCEGGLLWCSLVWCWWGEACCGAAWYGVCGGTEWKRAASPASLAHWAHARQEGSNMKT